MQRRTFLASTLAASAVCSLPRIASAAEHPAAGGQRIFKSLKEGMVRMPGSLEEKFAAVKAAGFDGIELSAPNFDIDEVRRAIDSTGLPVDGSVCAGHWDIRHTSPDPEQRKQALETLKEAIRTTHAVGGGTVLLVVGHGKDGEEAELIDRSIANIAQAIPVAAEVGVIIAIENVWNHFLYDHEGGSDQTADKLAAYVDAFESPWVGMQFDIGNHWKYGDPAAWIRTLGKRIVKLDAKGFSRAEDRFSKTMTDGDLDWASVRQALADIQYAGWAAAEVGGGGPERLAEISNDMDKAFGLS
ncbi:sugar phosphate isomerase/epimerase family protein [Candidatus Laterigemmans baculatus]|nr:sugar phosphate isomerase/epimerase family protein [Candidatus Laterigemmans baculatus]